MSEIGFERPDSVSEAVELLADSGSIALGGGTALMFLVREALVQPHRLVWLGAIPEIHGIRRGEDGRIVVGAGTTIGELARSPEIGERHPALSEAAAMVGNPRVRSVATVGGAIVHADPRQDLLPALLVADAVVHIGGSTGERSVRLRDGFFEGLMSVALREGELITAVTLPPPVSSRQRYVRFTPGRQEGYPTVAVAAAVRYDTGGISDVDLALGGVADTPVVVEGILDELTVAPTRETVAAAAAFAASATSPLDDRLGSVAYKRAMTRVWVERVFLDILDIDTSTS